MTAAPARIEDVLALTPLQQGLFALYRMAEEGLDVYTMQMRIDLDGPVDTELLRRSAAAMLERHPNLRAAFWDRDVPKPVQVIPSAVELPWTERVALASEFDAIARSERRRPFDLSRPPAMRIVLVSEPGRSRRRQLIFTAHHILMDGWALAVFFTELLAAYRAGGSVADLPAPRPYRDYIVWLGQQDATATAEKWVRYLSEVSGPLLLTDGALPVDQVPESTQLVLSAADTARLRAWTGRNGLTLNTAVLFAWTVVLSRLTDRRDVVFGTVVSGRPQHLTGVETMVGLFINSVPVVHRVSGIDSVVDQCARLQRESSAMRDAGHLSLSDIQRADGRGTLFDTMFVFENAPVDDAISTVTAPDGATFTPVQGESLTHYPVTVVSHTRGDELLILVESIPEAIPHLSAALICERLLRVVRQLPDVGSGSADDLDVLTDAERDRFTAAMPDATPAPDATVWELFERQVRETPDAVALTAGGGVRLSYRELHQRAAALAAQLVDRGVGPETLVALALPRSPDVVVAILAVLAAGGGYVPVDVTLPIARIESILRQAMPVLAITDAEHAGLVADTATLLIDGTAGTADEAPVVDRHPQQCAYVIFTSGSTGEPKGVIGTHAALLGFLTDHRERVYRPARATLGRPLRIAHAWSFGFDASWQPLVGLLDGHSVHLFDADEMRDARKLVDGMAAFDLDMIDTTPSMLAALRAAGLLDRPLSVLALGGEAINAALWDDLRAVPGTAVFNCYGPTETTVEAVVAPVHDYPAPTIGTANSGSVAYVLDSTLRVVPDGAIGELYLGGAQLARGYVGKAASSASRFVADPFRPAERMYRTGDLVRRLPHGGLGYLGRADGQVKIRGFRVEVGEIETALRGQAGVQDAAVSVVRGQRGTALVGFVVSRPDGAPDPFGVRAALGERLPAYMVPARVVVVDRLPMNVNGKLDGHALERQANDVLAEITADGSGSASTDVERTLGEAFGEQLGGAVPHVDDDFVALGLDSITAIALVGRVRRRGLAVTPRMVLQHTTIRTLAAAMEAMASGGSEAAADFGEVLPLPMVSWFCEFGNFRRFTHNFLLRLPGDIDRSAIEAVLQSLLDGHDTLRSILTDTAEGPRLVTRAPGVVDAAALLTQVELADSSDDGLAAAIAAAARPAIEAIDPRAGEMVRAVWFAGAERGDVLLLAAHHLTVDVVSWYVMLGGVIEAARAHRAGDTPKTLPEFTSYRRWSELMWRRAALPEVDRQRPYWAAQVGDPDPALGTRVPDPHRDTWSTLRVNRIVTPLDVTATLAAAATQEVGFQEFLLTVTTMTVAGWRRIRGQDPAAGALVALEGHGRADTLLEADTTNTVGSFIHSYPVRLGAGDVPDVVAAPDRWDDVRALLDGVAMHLRDVPNGGLDYGLLKDVQAVPELRDAPDPQIQFSYLGRVDLGGDDGQPWSFLAEPFVDALPVDPEPDLPLRFAVHVSALVANTVDGPQLITHLRWSDELFTAADFDRLADLWQRSVGALAASMAR